MNNNLNNQLKSLTETSEGTSFNTTGLTNQDGKFRVSLLDADIVLGDEITITMSKIL